jgi:hypothetical protein
MANQFLVFLSSVISERTRPFRAFIKQQVEASGWAYLWVFEKEPPSAALTESYMQKIDESDLFVLVVWDDITEIVEGEFQRALAAKVPVLLFRVKGDPPSKRLHSFISKVSTDIKWSEYTLDELPSAVQTGVISHLIETHRAHYFGDTRRQAPWTEAHQQQLIPTPTAPTSEQDAALVAGHVVPGMILRALPYYDPGDARSRIAVTARVSDFLIEKVFLLGEFGGGYRIEWESDKLSCIGAWGIPASWFGVDDVDGDKYHEVFFSEGSHGTGSGSDSYYMYVPSKQKVYSVAVEETRDPYYREWLVPCSELVSPDVAPYLRAFDERMKRTRLMGGISLAEESPDFLWYMDNGFLKNGRVKIRRFKGPPRFGASVPDRYKDGEVEWYAFFKGPVIGYDLSRDEHFVIYGPSTMYHWPTCFASSNEYLWFGTNGEGVFQFDKKREILSQMPKASQSKGLETVSSLAIDGSKLVVNGQAELQIPWW